MLQLNSTSPVLTHPTLKTLLLSNNAFTGLIPALPSELIASAALQATQGNAGDVVDLTAAAGPDGFDCPLPGTDDAYASAACTCATGRSGPDSGRFQCDACLPGSVAPAPGAASCTPCTSGRVVRVETGF